MNIGMKTEPENGVLDVVKKSFCTESNEPISVFNMLLPHAKVRVQNVMNL